jgi:hypothetical protein
VGGRGVGGKEGGRVLEGGRGTARRKGAREQVGR